MLCSAMRSSSLRRWAHCEHPDRNCRNHHRAAADPVDRGMGDGTQVMPGDRHCVAVAQWAEHQPSKLRVAGSRPACHSRPGRPVISLQRTMSGAVGGVCIAYDGSLRYGGKGSPATTMLCWVRGRNHLFAKQAILTDPKVRILHTAPMGPPSPPHPRRGA